MTYLCFSSPQACRPCSESRTCHPRSPGLPAGQTSPREHPRRRDPEVSFEFLARPLEVLLLPGRSLTAPWVAVETASMAAPRQASSRSVLREEAGGSTDSAVTTRTPAPAVSPGSPEMLVSPAQVAEPPGKNLWDQICEGRRPPLTGPGGTRADPQGRGFQASVRQAGDVRGRTSLALGSHSEKQAGVCLGFRCDHREQACRRKPSQRVAWCEASGWRPGPPKDRLRGSRE